MVAAEGVEYLMVTQILQEVEDLVAEGLAVNNHRQEHQEHLIPAAVAAALGECQEATVVPVS